MDRPARRLVRWPSRSLPVRIVTAACVAALVAGACSGRPEVPPAIASRAERPATNAMTMDAAGAINFEGGAFRLQSRSEIGRGDIMLLRFTGDWPVTMVLSGATAEGRDADVWMNFIVPRPFADSVQFTSALAQNRGRCAMVIRRGKAGTTVGTFECHKLFGGIYRDGRWVVLPRAFPWRLETEGRFVLAAS
jgi:hypothetical protein